MSVEGSPKTRENKKNKSQKVPVNIEKDPIIIAKRLQDFSDISPIPKNNIELTLKFNVVSVKDEQSIIDDIRIKGDWGFATKEERDRLANLIRNTNIQLEQAVSIRAHILKEIARNVDIRLKKKAAAVYSKYLNGQSVVSISKSMDFPPFNVLRLILAKMEYGKAELKRCLQDPSKLEPREQAQYKAACKHDSVTCVDQTMRTEVGVMFESVTASWLNSLNIRYINQDTMMEEQKASLGIQIATPDFLFQDNVFINGVKIHWLECKCFYGANLGMLKNQTEKQVARYVKYWGTGAVILFLGYNEAFTIKDCIMMDAQAILSQDSIDEINKKRQSYS